MILSLSFNNLILAAEFLQVFLNTGLARDKELVEPFAKLEQIFQQRQRMDEQRNDPVDPNTKNVPPLIILFFPIQPATRLIREVAVLLTNHVTNSIRKLEPSGRFELKLNMVQLLNSVGLFHGLSHEDPQQHIQTFLEISDTCISKVVNFDYVRLTLFPFSLMEEAKRWLHSGPPPSITSWEDLAQKFLIRFFISGKTARLRSEIISFRQKERESLY